ncbi:MAG: YdcF family protein [Candidatus Aenigmatarchaeota archaeon]
MTFDSIIVASNTLTPDRRLSEECRMRVDKGIELYRRREAPLIIMNGGPGKFTEGGFVPRWTRPVQCDVMKEYAVGRGVPFERIRIQDYSSDTVGEAYFSKEMLLVPMGLRNNIYVSSNYHLPRCKVIYDHILGDGFNTAFKGVHIWGEHVSKAEVQATVDFEKKALAMFREQFGDTPRGDSAAIEEALYTRHGIYSNISEEQRLRFHPPKKTA